MKVDIKFLESKEFTVPNPWNRGIPYQVYASTGNIDRISDSVFKFTEYNFLPADETDILDGHYTFFVNYKTFEYLVYKSSDYGGLTYVRPVDFKGFLTAQNLPSFTKKRVEALIAAKLLGAYFSDADALWRKGRNLFSDGTPKDKDGRYTDGYKRNLICDYRGYVWTDHIQEYSPIETKALSILCGYKKPTASKKLVKGLSELFEDKNEQEIHFKFKNKGYIFLYKKENIFSFKALIEKERGALVTDYSTKKTSDFIKNIPTMLCNYCTL